MDADDIQMIRESADRLLADHCDRATLAAAEAGSWPDALWTAVSEAGLTSAAAAEVNGGAGIPIGDALLLAGIAAEHAAPIPLGETIVASWLLDRAGLAIPDGPLSFAIVEHGYAHRAPWGRRATVIAIGDTLSIVAPSSAKRSANIAGEPRDSVAVPATLQTTPAPVDRDALRAIGAALRCVQIAGGLRRAVRLTADYARTRVQFGRALAQFQAIQQSLAVLATQASVATAAAEMAARAVQDGRLSPAVAVAKARCGEAAGIGSAIAHQVHGAIGFTREHDLQLLTRRLLSWRDEFGNEAHWNAVAGRNLVAGGADALWHRVTEI